VDCTTVEVRLLWSGLRWSKSSATLEIYYFFCFLLENVLVNHQIANFAPIQLKPKFSTKIKQAIMGDLLRRVLYKILPLETYLSVLSKMYFISFNRGWLKKNRVYDYPYFLQKIIERGDVCIDIGANLGYLSVVFAKLVGKNGKVYSVEPIKPVLSVLRKNTAQFSQVEIMPYALGTETKSIKLGNNTLDKKGFMASGSHFVLDKDEVAGIEFEAEMRQGSELFADLKKLHFIKCDIEGFETVVIPEIKPVILKFQPLVLVESNGEDRKQMLEFFEDMNYKGYVVNDELLYPAKLDEKWDILFIPAKKMDMMRRYAGEPFAKPHHKSFLG
jgi:FkbM family methyltransferase